MINQIYAVKTKTASLPRIDKDFLRVRRIQARLNGRLSFREPLPKEGLLWSPLTAGPYIVPVTRWIE